MGLTLVSAPTSEPVTIAEAKLWLRLDSDAEIDTVGNLIKAAREILDGPEGYLGRALQRQTWALTLDGFPCCREIEIPLPPLLSIDAVTYLDAACATQTLSASAYRADLAGVPSGRLILKTGYTWPVTLCEPASVTVQFTAGYSQIPEALRREIAGLAGFWFDNRDQVGRLPDGWSSNYKIDRF